MGAALTTQNAKSNLELRKRIDYIVKNLIFDSDFTDMTKLGNEKYCNRLVKKVSEVFNKNKDSIDIVLLRKKLYEMKKNKPSELELDEETTENVKRNDGQEEKQEERQQERQQERQEERQEERQITGGENRSTTRSRKSTTKKRMPSTPQKMQNIKKKCNEIAKFYVLFAHLFSCIVSTINPSFEIDASSSSSSSSDKKNTGSGSLDFCSSRLNSLINGELIENKDGDVTIRPNVCKTNLSESGTALRLVDLPGMKALLKLFKKGGDYDSVEDVKYLYKAFTGKDAPSDINIEDIPLHDFSKDVECSGSGSSDNSSRSDSRGGASETYPPPYYDDDSYRYRDRDREEREFRNPNIDVRSGVYLSGVKGNPTKEKLFSDYIKNIKIMIQKSENNRSLLLEILSEMFTYTYDSDDEISGVIINPSLTYKDLQSLVRRTRKIIIKLYTECEEDYNTGLDIFFALIQEKILSKLLLQDDMLQDFALRRRLNEYMIPNNLERSFAFQQNPYQNPYQQNPFQQNPYQPNVNKNQFIPPHFKQDVYKEVKRLLDDNNWTADSFSSYKSELDDWIEDEKNRVSGPNMLDPLIVAKEYFDSQIAPNSDQEYEEDEVTAAAPPALVSADPLAPDDDDDDAAVAVALAVGAPPSTQKAPPSTQKAPPLTPIQPKPIAATTAAAAAAPPATPGSPVIATPGRKKAAPPANPGSSVKKAAPPATPGKVSSSSSP
jgi:hypothetical protein